MSVSYREDLARDIAEMDREGLIGMLARMECTFKMDFTKEFLGSVSLEKLRHIVLSASLHVLRSSPSPA
jgi:hypothetical protein